MTDWSQVASFLTAPERVATLIMLCLAIAIWELLKAGVAKSVRWVGRRKSPKATILFAVFLCLLILALWLLLGGV